MKDAKETDLHWYEKAPQMKELNESNAVQNKNDSLGGNIINSDIENQKITMKDDITMLKDDTSMEYSLQNTQNTFDVREPPTLCKEMIDSSEFQECVHHDMADSSHGTSQDADHKKNSSDEQCVHSDAIKLGKTVKVNRVSPFRYGDLDSGNLLIDLTDNQMEEGSKRNSSQLDCDKNSKLKKKDEEKTLHCNGFSDDLSISQERYTTDLPRHNWLVKRLKQQNQLNEGDIISLHAAVNDTLQYSNEGKKEGKGIEIVSVHSLCTTNSQAKTIEVSKLPIPIPDSTQKSYDVMTVISKSSLNTETSTTNVNIHDTITPRSPIPINLICSSSPGKQDVTNSETITPRSPTKAVNMHDAITPRSPPKPHTGTSDPITPRSPVINNFVSSSSPTKQVSEVDLKPKLVMSSTLQPPASSPKKYPPPLPGIDLSSFKYDSLSRFNSLPKQPIQPQFYPSVSESYSIQQHNEGRSIRDVTRPVPLHLKESYKSERDAYGLNHRVRLSLTPLSTTKDRMTFRNQTIDKSTSVLKSYDTLPSVNLASPEVIKRNVAIQRQLENQKRWIAEHEPYKLNAANNASNYGDHNEGPSNQSMPSPLNPTNMPPSRFPPHVNEDTSNFNLDHISLSQSREYLKEKIDACNKEIKDIQQQKDVLFARQQGIPNTDSPTHLRIIALNRKLSSLEDYRMKQSALLMKLKAQPYDQRTQGLHDQRAQGSIKKPGYMDVNMNGGMLDADEIQAKQRMNPSDLSENLLLRQLQSKHDEGVSMVTMSTDSYCRTIDLSKTSEMFYNDMKMESLRMSQPSTPMSNITVKDYLHAGEIPPLVSAERLSPANGFPPRKPSISPGDYPHGHSLPFSQSQDVPRPHSLTHSSQVPDNQRSHEIIHSFKSQETLMSREIPMSRDLPHHLQYQKLARARELQHSMQVQELSRGPHDILHSSQFQDRQHPRPHSLNPHELSNTRPHGVNQQEISKSREIAYSQLQGASNDPMHNHYSPGSLPQSQPYPDSPYDDIRSHQYSKENIMKRHTNEPARPGQLKLARTAQNMMHQIHASQMDKNFPKILQHNANMNNRMENKYSPSNMPSVIPTGESPVSPYQRNLHNRYELMAQNLPSSLNNYEGSMSQTAVTPSYTPEKKKLRIRTCKACDKESQFLCSGCRGIWYCSRQCQLDDWKVHSKSCRKK